MRFTRMKSRLTRVYHNPWFIWLYYCIPNGLEIGAIFMRAIIICVEFSIVIGWVIEEITTEMEDRG